MRVTVDESNLLCILEAYADSLDCEDCYCQNECEHNKEKNFYNCSRNIRDYFLKPDYY